MQQNDEDDEEEGEVEIVEDLAKSIVKSRIYNIEEEKNLQSKRSKRSQMSISQLR